MRLCILLIFNPLKHKVIDHIFIYKPEYYKIWIRYYIIRPILIISQVFSFFLTLFVGIFRSKKFRLLIMLTSGILFFIHNFLSGRLDPVLLVLLISIDVGIITLLARGIQALKPHHSSLCSTNRLKSQKITHHTKTYPSSFSLFRKSIK